MTPLHLLFIPAVFILGVLVGLLAAARPAAGVQSATSPNVLPLQVTASVFGLVFVVTHLVPLAGGPAELRQVLHGLPLFDQHPSFAAEEVNLRLAAFGETARSAYREFTYTADLVFPTALLALLVASTRYLEQRFHLTRVSARALLAICFVWFGLDLAENAIVFHLLEAFPSSSPAASVLGVVTVAKFAALLAGVVSPALVVLRAQRLSSKRMPASYTQPT